MGDYTREELFNIIDNMAAYIGELEPWEDEEECREFWIDMGYHEDEVDSWFY